MVDILLAVLLGVLTLVTAYLGVHVTLHPAQSHREKWAYKIGFTLCGLAACILIGIQTYRNNAAQRQLHDEIRHLQSDTLRIEHNTEQPPRVQVNVPPPSVIFQNSKSVDHSKSSELISPLQSLSNAQLKRESLLLAQKMRLFERNTVIRLSLASSSLTLSADDHREQDSEEIKRINADGATVYDNTILNDAKALRAELWRRVGAVNPNSSLEAFEPLSPRTFHFDLEQHTISDAAAYLEQLAKQLPK